MRPETTTYERGAAQREWPLLLRLGSFLSRVLPASFFAIVCIAFFQDFLETGRFTSLVWILSEGLVVLLFITRRSTEQVSKHPFDWTCALLGTLLFLLVRPAEIVLVPITLGLGLQFTGMLIQVYGKIALGRSFGAVAANRGIVVGGPYRFVRHPIYTGYLVSHIGFFLTNASVWNLLIYSIGCTFQISRIIREERLLVQDESYMAYLQGVRYRLIPGLF